MNTQTGLRIRGISVYASRYAHIITMWACFSMRVFLGPARRALDRQCDLAYFIGVLSKGRNPWQTGSFIT